MAKPITIEVLELPLDVVSASSGLAFDIGSSIAKIVYRSNKEYRNGKPLSDQVDTKSGRVHLAMFPRENTDDVIAFIDENCDFTRDEEGVAHISATGVGGSTFKSRIEEKLKIKIKVLPEFDCFVKSFKILSRSLSKDRLLHPIPEKGRIQGELIEKASREWLEKSKDIMEGKLLSFTEEEKEEGAGKDSEDDFLPCMMVMAGSGTALMMLNKDGSYNIVDGVYFAGRSFLGLVAAATDERDFTKMIEMAASSDGRTATTFTSDLMTPAKEGEEKDMYNQVTADFPVFPLGKVYTAKKEDVTGGDIVHGIFYLLALVHAQVVQLQCSLNNIKTAYHCGNLVENEVARTNIILANISRNAMIPPDKRVDMQFLRNGGMYGALGAFFDAARPSTPTGGASTE